METRRKVGTIVGRGRERRKGDRIEMDASILQGAFQTFSTFASSLPRSIMELRISPPPYYIVRK